MSDDIKINISTLLMVGVSLLLVIAIFLSLSRKKSQHRMEHRCNVCDGIVDERYIANDKNMKSTHKTKK